MQYNYEVIFGNYNLFLNINIQFITFTLRPKSAGKYNKYVIINAYLGLQQSNSNDIL